MLELSFLLPVNHRVTGQTVDAQRDIQLVPEHILLLQKKCSHLEGIVSFLLRVFQIIQGILEECGRSFQQCPCNKCFYTLSYILFNKILFNNDANLHVQFFGKVLLLKATIQMVFELLNNLHVPLFYFEIKF